MAARSRAIPAVAALAAFAVAIVISKLFVFEEPSPTVSQLASSVTDVLVCRLLPPAPATTSISTAAVQSCDLPTALPLISNVFGDSMVLQQGVSARIWGWTGQGRGGIVVVSFRGHSYTSEPADANGRWAVELPPSCATHTGVDVIVEDKACGKSGALRGVLFGEVVWCNGQSNIAGKETPLSEAFGGAEEVAGVEAYPWIRVFAVGAHGEGSRTALPLLGHAPSIPWSVASRSSVARFSAVCWFHGRTLADELGPGVPLGLIESAWGGTPMQVREEGRGLAGCSDPPS